MKHYDFLIIGGGMAAEASVHGIREMNPNGTIGMISMEPNPPYDRPPLSKDLWTKKKTLDEIWRDLTDLHVDLFLSRTVVRIDQKEKIIYDNQNESYHFNKLLIATGGTPRRLKNDIPEIIYYRTLEDYKKLQNLSKKYKNFGIIGGGFIGAEIAAALTMNKKKVTMIFPEIGVCGLIFPPLISQYLTGFYQKKGITVITGEQVTSIQKKRSEIIIITDKNQEFSFDCVVVGIGIQPNVELAQSSGIHVDNGIIINKRCETSEPDIYAAGDLANFECLSLKKRMRFEHEDNANEMGYIAGKNMAGASEEYNHLPSFYSDLFDIGYEAVGEISAKMDTSVDWFEEYQEGVIYYLDQGRIRGILLWNVWEQLDAARELIQNKIITDKNELKGLIQKEPVELSQ